jgi:hypothetical protein
MPEVAYVCPDLFANPVALLAPGVHFPSSFLVEFPRSLARFAMPLPETIPTTRG